MSATPSFRTLMHQLESHARMEPSLVPERSHIYRPLKLPVPRTIWPHAFGDAFAASRRHRGDRCLSQEPEHLVRCILPLHVCRVINFRGPQGANEAAYGRGVAACSLSAASQTAQRRTLRFPIQPGKVVGSRPEAVNVPIQRHEQRKKNALHSAELRHVPDPQLR